MTHSVHGLQAERWAAPEPAAAGRGPSPGRSTSTAAPPGDRPMYTSDEGLLPSRAERWAAPEPVRIPSGDRPMYSSDEGLQ
jgi:hypothetical protein